MKKTEKQINKCTLHCRKYIFASLQIAGYVNVINVSSNSAKHHEGII